MENLTSSLLQEGLKQAPLITLFTILTFGMLWIFFKYLEKKDEQFIKYFNERDKKIDSIIERGHHINDQMNETLNKNTLAIKDLAAETKNLNKSNMKESLKEVIRDEKLGLVS